MKALLNTAATYRQDTQAHSRAHVAGIWADVYCCIKDTCVL